MVCAKLKSYERRQFAISSREDKARDELRLAHFWLHDNWTANCEFCDEREERQKKEADEELRDYLGGGAGPRTMMKRKAGER